MNPAIEYFLRKKLFIDMLTIPCSLFLFNPEKLEKIILSINTHNKEHLIVKKWNLTTCEATSILPSFKETIVERKNVFNDPNIILPDHHLMRFIHRPFPAGTRQYSTYPYIITQKMEYESYVDNFYNTVIHQEKKENWLWQEFKNVHSKEMNHAKISIMPLHSIFGETSNLADCRNQKKKLAVKNKLLSRNWNYWKKTMLFNNIPAAAELVFQKFYEDRIYEI